MRLREIADRLLRWVGHLPLVRGTMIGRVLFYRFLVLLQQRFPNGRTARRAKTNWGVEFDCTFDDNVLLQLYYMGAYSDREIRAIVGVMKPGDVFVDVGAHVGLFSVTVAKVMGGACQIIAIEPSPATAGILRRHGSMNGVADSIEVVECGLWDEDTVLELRSPHDAKGDRGRWSFFEDGEIVGSCRVRAFDDLVDEREIEIAGRIKAIKIDVEGSETRVIRGMQETIRRHCPEVIVMETVSEHLERAGSSIEELDGLMLRLGYRRKGRRRRANTLYERC